MNWAQALSRFFPSRGAKLGAEVRPDRSLPAMPHGYDALLGNVALHKVLQEKDFQSALDVGSGAGKHAQLMESRGKSVTRFDFGKSRAYVRDESTVRGDFLTYDFGDNRWDLVWACHVLEHSIYPHAFLQKLRKVCSEGGFVAVTVPPAKPEFVGGHVSLWTPALLAYRMVLAGFDCSHATLLRYGYNISIIVDNLAADVDLADLAWDFNDIERIQRFLPPDCLPGVNGEHVGLSFVGARSYFC